MIVRLKTPTEKKSARIKLYKDDVFLIAHNTIKELRTSLSLEELFVSADAFTSYLLDNELVDREIIQYEVDDLRDETKDENDTSLIVILTFIKLCALRKTKQNAEMIARAIVGFCQKYEGFTDLLKTLSKKEHSRWLENKRVNLLTYELRTIDNEEKPENAKDVIHDIVECAKGTSVESMQHIENVLSEVNDSHKHSYQEELNRLREARKQKSVSNVTIGKQVNTSCQQFMGKMENPKFIAPKQDEAI